MNVRYSLRARNDLVTILDYIDQRSPRGARNVKSALQRSIDLIGENPRIGPVVGRQKARRIPVGRPYLVYWTIDAGEVWILHIRHASRRPWQGEP